MEKFDALEFIGLREPYTEDAVMKRYEERYNYFNMLYSNAPNQVIERIQQQNLEKLNLVKSFLLEELYSKKISFDKSFLQSFDKPRSASTLESEKVLAGWLIVHTEFKKAVSFNLYTGINYIGRKKKEPGANHIIIADDPFISRTHAFIKCKVVQEKLLVELFDGDGSKPSANGVFLNGDENRIQHCFLKENDTIQVGSTKLVLKIRKENRSITGEVEDVLKTDFIKTIDVNR